MFTVEPSLLVDVYFPYLPLTLAQNKLTSVTICGEQAVNCTMRFSGTWMFVAGGLGEGASLQWLVSPTGKVVWYFVAKVDGNGSFKAQTRVVAPCLWHEPLIELIIQLWFWSRKPRRTFGRSVVMRWSMPPKQQPLRLAVCRLLVVPRRVEVVVGVGVALSAQNGRIRPSRRITLLHSICDSNEMTVTTRIQMMRCAGSFRVQGTNRRVPASKTPL